MLFRRSRNGEIIPVLYPVSSQFYLIIIRCRGNEIFTDIQVREYLSAFGTSPMPHCATLNAGMLLTR